VDGQGDQQRIPIVSILSGEERIDGGMAKDSK